MKHNLKITFILISMFFITQLIGLFVISVYENQNNQLPFGFETPEDVKTIYDCSSKNSSLNYTKCVLTYLSPLFIAFMIALVLFFLLTRINAEKILRTWFFIVVIIALGISIKSGFLYKLNDILFNLYFIELSTIS